MKKISIIDKIVYSLSKKPKYYVEVLNPPKTFIEKLTHIQDARQVQYNRWCQARKIYNGSYLPKNKDDLLNKGWVNENNTISKNNKPTNPSNFYRRKSSNQWVRNDKNDHWHWYNWWNSSLPKDYDRKNKGKNTYLDKYGKPCKRGSKESHINGK